MNVFLKAYFEMTTECSQCVFIARDSTRLSSENSQSTYFKMNTIVTFVNTLWTV